MGAKKRRSGAISAKKGGTSARKTAPLTAVSKLPKAQAEPDESVYGPVDWTTAAAALTATGTPPYQVHEWILSGQVNAATELWRQGNGLEALQRLHALPAVARNAEQVLVDEMREAGVSWVAIGAALGMTRQSAQERFGGR